MPDGQPTTEPFVRGAEVLWSSGDPSGPGDNVITQRLNATTEAGIAEAREADITFTDGPLTVTVTVLPSTSVSDAADIYVFDTGNDCVRLINTSPFVPVDVLTQYAESLLESWATP
jgi:hypothetical protein